VDYKQFQYASRHCHLATCRAGTGSDATGLHRSRLSLDRLTGSRTALWASWTNGLAAGRRTASVSQLR